jgi:predicted dienelactone hydrolase
MKPGKLSSMSVFTLLTLVSLTLSSCGPSNPYPLSEPGPYDFGTKGGFSEIYTFRDPSRDDRKVGLMVWYPAKLPEDATPSEYNIDAEPDLSGAPYPIILSSAKLGSIFGPHLASQGFVVVGIKGLDNYVVWDENLFNQPLDILFALDQVASNPLEGLEGMIDADHAGVMGYSFDGYNTLAVSGARVEPEHYLNRCANFSELFPTLPDTAKSYFCDLSQRWVEFSANAGPELTSSGDDGLWQPMTDERIRAVMPMAPDGAMIFGERGLQAVDTPTLLLVGAEDTDWDYYDREARFIFENIGTPEKAFITFLGEDHLMIFRDEPLAIMKHFITAFFGYHLQGNENYADYFSEKFVSRQDEVAWGTVEEK